MYQRYIVRRDEQLRQFAAAKQVNRVTVPSGLTGPIADGPLVSFSTPLELGQFDDTEELGSADLMRLRGLVSKLRWIDRIVLANWPEEAERGEALGIFPMRDRRDPVLDRAVCSSFLSPSV